MRDLHAASVVAPTTGARMTSTRTGYHLDRPVDPTYDHVLGPANAEITLVEYGSYACPYCRAANDRIAAVRDQFGDRLRYVFRHRPLTGNALARQAAELVERARTPEQFWKAHIALMTRSETLTEEDLRVVEREIIKPDPDPESARRAKERVDADVISSYASGVLITPTFFINGRRYDGPWDESSFADAMLGSLGHRVRAAALDFASWAPSAGVLLLLMTILAVIATNTDLGAAFEHFWELPWGFTFGNGSFHLPLREWVNDGLLTVFFLVVGLEIKREFTVGHLSNRRSAALPVAAAIGGMTVPALIYIWLIPEGQWAHGWGVPMATDTAFAVALIVMLGQRVPIELRIFLTAAAIVDDIGAIIVVAFFYSSELRYEYLGAAAALTLALAMLNRAHVYRVTPYFVLGIILWACVYNGGLHATLTGVILALFMPTRPPPDLNALTIQASTIIKEEAVRGEEVLRHGPSVPALEALDAIHDRLESPASRLLRNIAPSSSYGVLPVFALANAGVVMHVDVIKEHEPLMLAIIAGLTIGKPLGFVLASALAVKLRLAIKPSEYSWLQLAGVGMLAGIGFTMSLFIAGQAFPDEASFDAAKIAVFTASVISAITGVVILWKAADRSGNET